MQQVLKNNTILLALAAIFIVCVFLTAQFSWRGPDRKGYTHVIDSDGKGYYNYLPAIFIKKNITSQSPDGRYIFQTEKGAVNKYFAGTAVAMLPFFAGGCAVAAISNKPLTGYSPPFQRAISIAGWFYLCLGLIFTAGLLMLYDIKTELICITMLTIVFGTNLLMYAVYHPSFSHIYSFCFVSMFLYYSKKFFINIDSKTFLGMAFSLAMIIIIRPTNGIILIALPLMAGSKVTFISTFKKLFSLRIIPGALLFIAVISIQPMLWYLQTGEFFLNSYQNEGFFFSHPEIIKTLFSFRKGFFIYTPIALISLAGIYILAKRNKTEMISAILFFITLIYLTASWWNWYYGPSFSQRPFIEFYALNSVLLALLFTSFRHKKKLNIFFFVIGLFVALNLLQSFQYVKNIISPWDMNAGKYAYTFLRTSPKYYGCLGGNNDIVPYPGVKTFIAEYKNDFERRYEGWSQTKTRSVGAERKTVCDYSGLEFNSSFHLPIDSMLLKYRSLFAEITIEKLEIVPGGKAGPLMGIVLFDKKKKNYHYHTFLMNEIPVKTANRWASFKYNVEIPQPKQLGDSLGIYVWNNSKQQFLVDNFHIRLYGIK